MIPTIEWLSEKYLIKMIDQTQLPGKLEFMEIKNYRELAKSIKNMNIRGAPAIGVAAAMGMALAALEFQNLSYLDFKKKMIMASEIISSTRPTAVNLFWAIEKMKKLIFDAIDKNPKSITFDIIKGAITMAKDDIKINKLMGKYGSQILDNNDTVLTHCNAGSLATVMYGTALAPIRYAVQEEKKKIQVIADETRPRLQGARLTAWELNYDNIPVKVEVDNTSGLMMRLGKIQKVIVGADRIVKDAVFNKIGTYMVAICAKYHNIPMYVVAPRSTLSLDEYEKDILIEQRDGWFEVAELMGRLQNSIVPNGIECINYAFDATPMDLITGIITEDGLFKPKELIEKYC